MRIEHMRRPPLPEPLPDTPLPLVEAWLEQARQTMRNATSMTLATVDPDGRPSARMVICRGFDATTGWFVFYTDRDSPKGRALEAHPRAALVFHWDALERQIRIEGPVTVAPEEDSDRYWSTRPLDARIAAIASDQSRPIASRAAMLAKVEEAGQRFGAVATRPPRWGGYRVWAERVELWVGQPARVHDRAAWTRALEPTDGGFSGGPWAATRLQP
jgi:pyridoxamine 5'-phosphate oxidase